MDLPGKASTAVGTVTPEQLARSTVLLAHGQGRDPIHQAAALVHAGRLGISRDKFLFEVFCVRFFALVTPAARLLYRTPSYDRFWAALYDELARSYDKAVVDARYVGYCKALQDAQIGPDHPLSGKLVGTIFTNSCGNDTPEKHLLEYAASEYIANYNCQQDNLAGLKINPGPLSTLTWTTAQISESVLSALVRGKWRKYLSLLLCIAALLTAEADDWPNLFFVLLRLGVSTVSLYWAVQAFKRRFEFWMWALGANAVLFNPVVPLRMERSDWQIVNLLDAVFLASWICVSTYRAERTDRAPGSRPSVGR